MPERAFRPSPNLKASRLRFLEILYASVGGKYDPHEGL